MFSWRNYSTHLPSQPWREVVNIDPAKLARKCVVLQVSDPIELLKSNSTFQMRLLLQSLTLRRISAGLVVSGWPVWPSDITKKAGGGDGGEGQVGGGRGRRMLMRSEAMRFALSNEILKTTAAITAPTKQSTNLLTSVLFLKWQGLWKGQMIAASSYAHRAQ